MTFPSSRHWLFNYWCVLIFALTPVFASLIFTARNFPPPIWILARVAMIIAATALLLYLLIARLVRTARTAAVMLATLCVLFVLYPMTRQFFVSGGFLRLPVYPLAIFYALGTVLVVIGVAFVSTATLDSLYETAVAMAVVLSLAYAVIIWQVYMRGSGPSMAPVVRPADRPALAATLSAVTSPDVYHIILDAFGRSDTLRAQYGLDLTDFSHSLNSRGFEVYEDAVANYPQTFLSIASMLNVTYLDQPAEDPQVTSRVPMHEMIQHSPVLELFKRSGYQFVFIGSIYSATQSHRLADECVCDAPIIGEFESSIIGITPFRDIGFGGLDYSPHRNKILRSLASLESLGPSQSPRIVLAHLLAPHPPFVFDETGRPVNANRAFSVLDGSMFEGTREEYVNGYKGQARYLSNRLQSIVDHLEALSRAEGREAFIVIHGDHGPRARFSATDAGKTDPTEVLPIFLAIHWPSTASLSRSPVHSLVNVYREFIRRFVDPRFEQLRDRAFISSIAEPYRFLEIDVASLAPKDQ
jgi:hypothetical protein